MESSNPLPKTLPGAVCEQWRTCGRKNCRCARGQPHGPYYYRFFRVNGRLRKEYVFGTSSPKPAPSAKHGETTAWKTASGLPWPRKSSADP